MSLELLKVYQPANRKIRLGRDRDGGYVVVDGYNYDLLLSAGIGGDISFETDFIQRYNIGGFAFDGNIKGVKCPDKLTFVNTNVGSYNFKNLTDLKEYAEGYKDIFVKMDIEGAEWDWIPWFDFNNVRQFVFEGHNCFQDKAITCFEKLNRTHHLVHIHSNNNGHRTVTINNITYPTLLEFTFLRKDCMVKGLNKDPLPVKGLDFPNVPGFEEYNMNVWPFKG